MFTTTNHGIFLCCLLPRKRLKKVFILSCILFVINRYNIRDRIRLKPYLSLIDKLTSTIYFCWYFLVVSFFQYDPQNLNFKIVYHTCVNSFTKYCRVFVKDQGLAMGVE